MKNELISCKEIMSQKIQIFINMQRLVLHFIYLNQLITELKHKTINIKLTGFPLIKYVIGVSKEKSLKNKIKIFISFAFFLRSF